MSNQMTATRKTRFAAEFTAWFVNGKPDLSGTPNFTGTWKTLTAKLRDEKSRKFSQNDTKTVYYCAGHKIEAVWGVYDAGTFEQSDWREGWLTDDRSIVREISEQLEENGQVRILLAN